MKMLCSILFLCSVFISPSSGFAESNNQETKTEDTETVKEMAEMLFLLEILEEMAFLSDMEMIPEEGDNENE